MRSCDTGACLRADPQPDGSVVVYSTLDPLFRTVRFTAEEWAAHVADLEAAGYRRAIADLRGVPELANDVGEVMAESWLDPKFRAAFHAIGRRREDAAREEGRAEAIADLRDTDAVWRWANETGTASRTIPATGWPHQIHDLADYLEAQTKPAEAPDA